MGWLDADSTTALEATHIPALKLQETMQINHNAEFSEMFTLSKLSGFIAMASSESKPSLSVIGPGTNKPPIILSEDGVHTSALFITISDQEYLVATTVHQIQIWNLERNTSSVAYKFQESERWRLCVIDERTIACVAAEPSSGNHFSKIYILKTDTEKFSLNSTIRIRTDGPITDICYLKRTDGTACLLLVNMDGCFVQCIEMVGGRVQWQVDQQKMGKLFFPRSICANSGTVFIADIFCDMLDLLSAEDGSVLVAIRLSPFGLLAPNCVRLKGENLYVGHENKEGTYCISKLTKSALS